MDNSIAQGIMPEMMPLVLKTGGALIVIIAILVAMLFIAKKFSSLPGIQDEIRITGSKHLSPKKRLVLVEVLGKKILLGITSGKIEKIETFELYNRDRTFIKELERNTGNRENENRPEEPGATQETL